MSRFMAECPHCGEMFDDEDAWFEHGRLQAEAERLQAVHAADKYLIDQLYRQRDDYAMHNMAVRQCTGIPRSVGVSEPVEGFEDRPQDLAPAMREMALIIEADKARIAELEERLSRCKRELTRLNQVLHDRNIALDALHYVWCNGGCQTGMHRFGDGVLTEEILLQAEVSVKRMRIWFDNKRSRDKNHAQRMSALSQQGKDGET